MLNRRMFCGCGAAAFAASVLSVPARAEAPGCKVITPDAQRAIKPAEALARLKEGNGRFVDGNTINCDLRAQVRETASGQAPFAAVVGCIDSRVPPELVFDQRIGDIFCARVAGNFVNTDILASLEFATQLSGAKAIVVLGHNNCGAIKGAVDHVRVGHLGEMLANFQPAIAASKVDGPRNSKNAKFVQDVAVNNVRMTVASLTKRSKILRKLVADGQLVIAPAMHDLSTGKVQFM